jgi:hypothetical protein
VVVPLYLPHSKVTSNHQHRGVKWLELPRSNPLSPEGDTGAEKCSHPNKFGVCTFPDIFREYAALSQAGDRRFVNTRSTPRFHTPNQSPKCSLLSPFREMRSTQSITREQSTGISGLNARKEVRLLLLRPVALSNTGSSFATPGFPV